MSIDRQRKWRRQRNLNGISTNYSLQTTTDDRQMKLRSTTHGCELISVLLPLIRVIVKMKKMMDIVSKCDTIVIKTCTEINIIILLGIDRQLAVHIAHLFIRDPLAVYAEQLNISDDGETDHFENINSTNWQTVRFKPPPPGSNIGWRVEMRPIEVCWRCYTKRLCICE